MLKDENPCHYWIVATSRFYCVDLLTKPRFWLHFDYNRDIPNKLNFFIMTTVLNRDSIKVKRDLQKRVENWVADYCDA